MEHIQSIAKKHKVRLSAGSATQFAKLPPRKQEQAITQSANYTRAFGRKTVTPTVARVAITGRVVAKRKPKKKTRSKKK